MNVCDAGPPQTLRLPLWSIPMRRHRPSPLARLGAVLVLIAGVVAGPATAAHAATTGPCDIYGSAGTPCVAAHSTVRALAGAYNGPLYQLTRASDRATHDVGLLAAGGYANAGDHDAFCNGTTC